MNAERNEELAALHALDLLDEAERAEFAAAVARDPKLADLARELREASSHLALTAPSIEPPASLKSRLLASVAADAARSPAPRSAPTAARVKILPFTLPLWAPWAAAACFALAAAWLGRLVVANRTENFLLQQQVALAELELTSARNQFAAERIISSRQVADLTQRIKTESDLAQFKIAMLTSLAGNSPKALAVAVWNPSAQQGVLAVSKLPPLPSDKDYQLWVIDPQYPIPVDGGVFTVDQTTGEARYAFKADKPIKFVAKFAVSLERKGGVPKAEGPIVMLSQ